jgi:PKD domain/Malectin domain/Domain of unknown function (DUF5122) beta-propeller
VRQLLRIFLVSAVALVGLISLTTTSASALQSVTQNQLVSANPANFTPNVLDGEVDSLAQVGNTIIAGGSFTQVQAASGGPVLNRTSIFAFNKDTGAISTTFAPALPGGVKAVAAGPNNTVYVGGKFNTAGGATAFKIVKLNVADGSIATGWKPRTVSAIVQDVRYINGRLFIAGQFTTIGPDTRTRLAELNPTTGAVMPFNVPVQGTHFGGDSQVYHMDVNPQGTKMVLVGNFTSVGGQPRTEIAMVDLTTNQVSDWQTSRFQAQCFTSFNFIIRDAEFSPDGSYFAVGTTGGYGSGSPSMCDSISRWDPSSTGPNQDPTWVDYTGGDSTYTVTPTGAALYYGGHERWVNNPAASDAQGPGAVARAGIGALDPVNGLPLTWNPGRDRGQGVFDMLATTDGLFFGSDTEHVAQETRKRLAFFPLAGGASVPQPGPVSLPVKLYSLGDLSSSGTNVLYRVNAGGAALPSADGGPDWAADATDPSAVRNGGSNSAAWSPVPSVNASVPHATPSAIFDTERWDPADATEMHWNFPVPAGTPITVRLYFANRCSCTSGTGLRRFNVSLDGQQVLNNFDVFADAGDQTGEMKAFDTVSDGTVDLDFGHVTENPLVNGIEILDRSVAAPLPGNGVTERTYNGSTFAAPVELPDGGNDWSGARGAFYVNDTLYTAWADGHLDARTFDGSTFGPAQTIDLNGLTNFAAEMRNMTGLFYDNGRIYYTLAGQHTLYMRYFTVQSNTVGAGLKDLQPFQVSGSLSDVDWGNVHGMTLVGGKLYWADRTTGNLNRVDFTNGVPVAGTDAVVSGPSSNGIRWAQTALFAVHADPDQPPVARFSSSCSQLTCSFDGTGSSDKEGPVTYSWDFGDGHTSTAAQPQNVFAAAGTYHVTLSVTDGAGQSNAVTHDVVVSSAAGVSYVDSAISAQSGSVVNHSFTVPSTVHVGDSMVMYFTNNAPAVTVTAPSGWTQVGTQSTGGSLTRIWSRTATAADPGSQVTVSMGSAARGLLGMSAYRGASGVTSGDVTTAAETVNRAAHTTPTSPVPGSSTWVLSLWTDKTAATTTWAAPGGQVVRNLKAETGTGHTSLLATDDGRPALSGTAGGLTATADSATTNAVMTTIEIRAAG